MSKTGLPSKHSFFSRASARQKKLQEAFQKYFNSRKIGATHEEDILFEAFKAGAKWERQKSHKDHN